MRKKRVCFHVYFTVNVVITFAELTKELWLIPVTFGHFFDGINSIGYYDVSKYVSYYSV